MDKTLKIIEMTEHPERFSEEEIAELLADDDALAMYMTVCDVEEVYARKAAESLTIEPSEMEKPGLEMQRMEWQGTKRPETEKLGTERAKARVVGLLRWTAAACVAAVAVGAWMMINNPAKELPGTGSSFEGTGGVLAILKDKKAVEKSEELANSAAIAVPSVTPHVSVGKGQTASTVVRSDARLDAPSANIPNASTDLDSQLRLMQARIDSDIAESMAEMYLAEYYAQQMENLQSTELPGTDVPLGDDFIPQHNIMTFIME